MEIISHRGYWKTPEEKNTEVAFRRSFELGFGTETDIRDLDGEVIISHDMPCSNNRPITLARFLEIYTEYNINVPLALNVKSDGMQNHIAQVLRENKISNYYLFDMSVPDAISTKKSGLNFLVRQSEFEPISSLIDSAEGVWLDELEAEWIKPSDIFAILDRAKKAFVVSPELHGRDMTNQWTNLCHDRLQSSDQVYLCTDLPEAAYTYFSTEMHR